jgi:ankyrin repeat protein
MSTHKMNTVKRCYRLFYRKDIAEFLLSNGADVDLKDEKGRTALHYAAQQGQDTKVQLLLGSRPNIDAKDRDGEIALQRAVWQGHLVVIERLLDAGADINS